LSLQIVLLHLSLCIVYGIAISCQRSKGRKLCRALKHRHRRMLLGHVVRMVDYVFVIVMYHLQLTIDY